MNYLAHILLANENENSILGNFLGDFIKKIDSELFNMDIIIGIRKHRAIDSYTDSHPFFLQSKRRISQLNRRFAGVLVDIFYDHFLAKNWSLYSKVNMNEYINRFYSILVKNYDILPKRLQLMMHYMIDENWLLSYIEINGIEKTLIRLSYRSSKITFKLNGIDELLNNYEDLEKDFLMFFPELVKYSESI